MNKRNVYKVAEVAALFRVSRMTVYRLITTGELKSFKVGKSFRIPRESLEDYVLASGMLADELVHCPRCGYIIDHDLDCPTN